MSATTANEALAWNLLQQVFDPEVPVVSIVDLGIVRAVEVAPDGGSVTATLTPTYSGCPALLVIEQAAADALRSEFDRVTVRTVLSPFWTTSWITEQGRDNLREAGIAPPLGTRPMTNAFAVIGQPAEVPACPHCDSLDVERISEFGATACKALWRCRACAEPFEYFKPI